MRLGELHVRSLLADFNRLSIDRFGEATATKASKAALRLSHAKKHNWRVERVEVVVSLRREVERVRGRRPLFTFDHSLAC